ncbi:MAG TPA: ABC transporter ATP-binding protein [Chloroflexia bacterium]|nr:ABC transporter ATP-binding protein [Chloroflexia bacterium]
MNQLNSGDQTTSHPGNPLLEAQNITVRFKGIVPLQDVSFEVQPGELFAIIGPNGAGKSSLFNVLSRIYHPATGSLKFNGLDLLSLSAHQLAKFGVARTFQNLGLFPHLTVLDNVMVGKHAMMKTGLVLGGVYFGPASQEEEKHRRRCLEILGFLNLLPWAFRPVQDLPYGIQKKVELARALALEPKLLLMDEPVAGMNLEETEEIASAILDIKQELGITQILVEHDMAMIMGIVDRIMVLDLGKVIATGTPAQIQSNTEVIKAYLGTS